MQICGRDERMLAAQVEQKNVKGRQKWRDASLTKKAPYKPNEGLSPRIETPHPPSLCEGTLSHNGKGEEARHSHAKRPRSKPGPQWMKASERRLTCRPRGS